MASSAGREHCASRRLAGSDFYLLPNPVRTSGTYPGLSQPAADGFVRNRGIPWLTRSDTFPVELLVHESNPVLHSICPWVFRLENFRAGLLDVRNDFPRFGSSRSQHAKASSLPRDCGELLRGDNRLHCGRDHSAGVMAQIAPERVDSSYCPIL